MSEQRGDLKFILSSISSEVRPLNRRCVRLQKERVIIIQAAIYKR
jgi:hypothetical protein